RDGVDAGAGGAQTIGTPTPNACEVGVPMVSGPEGEGEGAEGAVGDGIDGAEDGDGRGAGHGVDGAENGLDGAAGGKGAAGGGGEGGEAGEWQDGREPREARQARGRRKVRARAPAHRVGCHATSSRRRCGGRARGRRRRTLRRWRRCGGTGWR